MVNINNVLLVFFFCHLNKIEAYAEDVGYAYPQGFAKDVFHMTGPGKYNPAGIIANPLFNQRHYPLVKEFMVK